MSHTTPVSGVSSCLWSRRRPRRTGQVTSRSVGSVSPVSPCPVASGLQIGLQNRRLICSSTTFPALPQLPAAIPGAPHPVRARRTTSPPVMPDAEPRRPGRHHRRQACTRASTAPLSCPGPSPEPDCCRTLRQAGSVQGRRSDHAVAPQAPWTGSGWREYSYGGFGGGNPHFHPHTF
jgi:hypothetical protein